MMTFRHHGLRRALGLLCSFSLLLSSASAATLNFTLTTSKPVTVTGTPRIAIDVGGVTRYATYAAGTNTNTLTFSYTVQARDFDANGIALVSPLDLNGGTIKDAAGNPAASLGFSLPDTSGVRIQTYTTAFVGSSFTASNANAASFTINKAPAGGTYSYTITSSGGAGTVTGSGSITGSPQTVSNVDVSSLPVGTLTLSLTVSTAAGGTGSPRTATAALDNVAPTGYAVAGLPAYVALANQASTGFQITGGEIGSTYSYTISSSAGGTPVTSTGTVTADPQPISGLNLSGLNDGTLTVAVTLTDTNGNAGSAATATVTKDTVAPTIVSVTPPAAGTFDDL